MFSTRGFACWQRCNRFDDTFCSGAVGYIPPSVQHRSKSTIKLVSEPTSPSKPGGEQEGWAEGRGMACINFPEIHAG